MDVNLMLFSDWTGNLWLILKNKFLTTAKRFKLWSKKCSQNMTKQITKLVNVPKTTNLGVVVPRPPRPEGKPNSGQIVPLPPRPTPIKPK
ncbi:MAG TPA: hypothetical protein VE344_10655 [Methylomirabilota bacterium]|nr:hypothetical protein [Methylomirabilota bacterium]